MISTTVWLAFGALAVAMGVLHLGVVEPVAALAPVPVRKRTTG